MRLQASTTEKTNDEGRGGDLHQQSGALKGNMKTLLMIGGRALAESIYYYGWDHYIADASV